MSFQLTDMDDPVQRRLHVIQVLARNLVRDAESLGIVVSITPTQTDSGVEMVIDVKPANVQ